MSESPKVLKHLTPKFIVHSDKMAIVGSSGRLAKSPKSKEIDAFDCIIRFNRAPVEGYEDMVGSKTTLRIANSHVFKGRSTQHPGWDKLDQKFVPNLKNSNILYVGPAYIWANRKRYIIPENQNSYYILNNPGALRKSAAIRMTHAPSAGFTMVLIALSSGLKPHLFGFDVEKERYRDHYWEKRGPPSHCHNVNLEKQNLLHLERAGRLTIHR